MTRALNRRTLLAGVSVAVLAAPLANCTLGDDILTVARQIDALVLKVGAAIALGASTVVKVAAADYQALLGFMPTVAAVTIQIDSWTQSAYSLGVLQATVVKLAGTNLATQQADLKTLASAVAGIHNLAGSSLITNAANGSVVKDPQTFFSQVVATALNVRAATRGQVTAVVAASNGAVTA